MPTFIAMQNLQPESVTFPLASESFWLSRVVPGRGDAVWLSREGLEIRRGWFKEWVLRLCHISTSDRRKEVRSHRWIVFGFGIEKRLLTQSIPTMVPPLVDEFRSTSRNTNPWTSDINSHYRQLLNHYQILETIGDGPLPLALAFLHCTSDLVPFSKRRRTSWTSTINGATRD